MRSVGLFQIEHILHLSFDRLRIHQLPGKPLGLLGVHQLRNLGKLAQFDKRNDNRYIGSASLS